MCGVFGKDPELERHSLELDFGSDEGTCLSEAQFTHL